ncbi:pyrophosphate--fructose 6-phosphate 1-phosphotransferase subunit alpha-like isoform X2 [Alnus glutinosa]|uniref:pyrophosphate--fructose 6-phosphate 1-phosphotransferase subunit alpha-like isoform X2 n=1 Tax=Alnus glutinosa TaxID=3517 RepID=UPI002D783EEE|nr:pyrophosphate--fructose 6-phosphate 1-phosphotransferase subunit alpha-like isoform X2 [Alnus glutinosa]
MLLSTEAAETGSGEVLARLVVLGTRKQMFCNGNPEKLLKDNPYQNQELPQLYESDPNKKAIGFCTEDLVYMEKIKELQDYLEKVKNMVKPGCSQEVLKVALSSMSSLVNFLSSMSTRPKLHASL